VCVRERERERERERQSLAMPKVGLSLPTSVTLEEGNPLTVVLEDVYLGYPVYPNLRV
jgi:hypothetical protein